MNLSTMLKLQSAWSSFKQNHPKFPLFLKAVAKNALVEGTIIEVHVKTEDGNTYQSNLKLNQSDLELINELKNMLG